MKYIKYLPKEVRTMLKNLPNKMCLLYQTTTTKKNRGKRTKYQTTVKQREVQTNKANLQHGAAGDACGC